MKPFFALLLREMLILRRRALKQLLAHTVPPLLFLITFGWGLRDRLSVDGSPYILFMIPGLIAMSSMRQSFSLSSDINISRFYWKTFDEIRSTPVSDLTYTAGEVSAGVIKGWLAAAVILILALLFGVTVRVTGLFALSVTLNALIFSSIAVITSMLVRGHADQGLLTNFVITPMAFLCGTFFPLESYPAWVRYAVYALPLTHGARAIRASALGRPYPFSSLIYLAGAGAVCFLLAAWVIRKSKD
jgi:ABC-type multidrug transport system permease subunit